MRIENTFLGVRGVGERIERRLWERGVTHWDEFDGEGDGIGPTIAERIESFITTGRARLDAGDSTFFGECLPGACHWRLYENFRDEACFLDIETTGLSSRHDVVTTVSVHRGGTTRTYVRGQNLTRDALLEELEASSLLVTFNGRQFDVPFLETSFDLDVPHPHVDLRSACRLAGVSGGLKRVEPQFGIERVRPDIDGRDAVRLWYDYERGNDDALDTLISYNREDAANLEPLADAVARQLHEEQFARCCPDG